MDLINKCIFSLITVDALCAILLTQTIVEFVEDDGKSLGPILIAFSINSVTTFCELEVDILSFKLGK